MFGAPLNVVVSAVSLLCFDSFGQSEEYEMKTEHSVYYELLLFTPLSILLFSSHRKACDRLIQFCMGSLATKFWADELMFGLEEARPSWLGGGVRVSPKIQSIKTDLVHPSDFHH